MAANTTSSNFSSTSSNPEVAALAAELVEFEKWAEDAYGCDWCCGGGDEWVERLAARRDALGFSSWEEFRAAAGMPVPEPVSDTSESDDPMDGDAESALASCGWGTDEDYGGCDDGDF